MINSNKMEDFSKDLPMELVTEVLARVPVKSLLRFRCVWKAWCCLSSSPDFASLHLSRYHNHDDHTRFLVATTDALLGYQWMLLSSHTYEKINGDDYAILNNQMIMDHFDYCYPRGSSVNGLLLLSKESFDPNARCQTQLLLWNPMLGKTLELPCHCINPGAYFGFGFSSSSDDYKVVAISAMEEMTSVHVYSLSTHTWRDIVEYRESIMRVVCSDGFHLVEGIMNFRCFNLRKQTSHMVLFDVNNEVFRYIQLPLSCKGFHSYAVVYQEKVGVLDFDYQEYRCHLWVTEKTWASESWRKLYTVGLHAGTSPRLLCFKENEEFMLSYKKGEVVVYDVGSGEAKYSTERSPYCRSAVLYSL